MKTIFITAGLGSEKFHLASKRLISQISCLDFFDTTVCVDERMLRKVYPSLFETYSDDELFYSKGFGYYSWKSILVNSAVKGYWGKFDLVVYMDAGCEVLPGRRTKRIFKELSQKALETGCAAFAIKTPELQYSKSAVVQLFPELPFRKLENQIQSGTLFVSTNEKGSSLACQWSQMVMSDPKLTNDLLGRERDDFIAHRHDQSIFSLLFKTQGFVEERTLIPYPRQSFVSKLRAVRYPIWWARNTSDKTSIPLIVRILARVLF